jgi:exonuclease SbcC
VKILAIRGCNLASLAGEFEIDLARAPLGGAGVFAIVGNTGAGKSTLLDALCVALFDRTPRLTNHSTVKVGRGSDDRALLGAHDVRTLLRRGAAQGWAEVDFESGDARQYRARWSVRRARGQSDGALQDDQLSLTAIAGGERFGGTKTETLKAIHARLGLSFDQFRRSALLAQGEFAAFLRADGKDRSELLERMTGTQIYSQLSIAAHQRAALAEQRLRDARAAAQAIAVLDDAALLSARTELEAALAGAVVARRRHALAEQIARWTAEARRRADQLGQAAAEHTAARSALIAAEADRAELALRRRAEQLRPAWDEVARLDRAVAVALDERTRAGAAAERGAAELAQIAERRAAIAASQAPVRAARIAAGIVERSAADGAEPLARTLPEDAAWLSRHRALAPEIAGWPELETRFDQRAALGEAIAALDRALDERTQTRAALDRARKTVAGELRAASHRHDDAKRKAHGYAQKRGLALEAARRLEDQARTRLGEVERLVAIAAAARADVAARDEIDRALDAISAAVASDAVRWAQLGDAQRLAQVRRAEQARAVDDLRRAAGYQHARAELVEHEPCPLCGATEHPWRDRGALDDVIAGAVERLGATQAELDAIAGEAAAFAIRDHQRADDRARLAAQRAAAIDRATASGAAWQARLGALGELLLVDDPASPAAEDLAADRQALAHSALEQARTTRSQTEAATKAAQDAQAEVQLCQVAVDQLASKLGELDRRLAELDADLGRIRGERASKREHGDALTAELDQAMQRWLAALPETGAGADPVAPSAVASAGRARASSGSAIAGSAGGAAQPSTGASGRAVAAAPGGTVAAVPGGAVAAAPGGAVAAAPGGAVAAAPGGTVAAAPGGAVAAAPGGAVAAVPGGTVAAVPGGAVAAAPGGAVAAAPGGAVAAVPGGAVAAAPGGPPGRAIDAGLALALVGQLQRIAAPRAVRDTAASSPAAIVRIAMAGAVAVWRACAERIAHGDAVLSAAAASIDRAARDAERAVAEQAARRDAAGRRRDALGEERAEAAARLEQARGAAQIERDELARLLSADPSRVDALAERLAALERAVDHKRAVVAERERHVAEHAAARPVIERAIDPAPDQAPDPAIERAIDPVRDPELELDALAAAVATAERRAAQLAATLAADAEARTRRSTALQAIAADEAGAEVDRILGGVIGSHDGKLFRSFAQSLTLDGLLAVANGHLEELAPRYQLERVPRHDLELQVIDRDLGAEVRSVQSLSGGESFLVSLALALGLSSMSAHDVRVRTLLIDEGFGTLDPATLDSALSVLDALQATGRQVGVISHVPALVERVGAHVRVVQRGGGRSEVIVA